LFSSGTTEQTATDVKYTIYNDTYLYNPNYKIKTEYYSGINLGASFSLGSEYKISNNWSICAEIFGRLANFSPSKYISTVERFNSSEDSPLTFKISGDFIEKAPTIMELKSIQNNPNLASSTIPEFKLDRAAFTWPLNSMGISVGVRYYLKIKTEPTQ
jgi:hypothetical protein